MESEMTGSARETRGRVVMLVDNDVHSDSRVQKSARSVAEAGWDVTLLGLTKDETPQTWQVGPAVVRLLPMPVPLITRSALRRGVSFWYGRLRRSRPGRIVTGVLDRTYTRYWLAREGDAAWRRLEPGLWDFELTYGPVIDELKPDIIHAHDFRMIGVGARAVLRARGEGRDVKFIWDAHEYLPGITPWRDNVRWHKAHLAYEREYVPYADAVITVSDTLAHMLQRQHKLEELPAVVLNAPAVTHTPTDGEPVADLRAICGVGPAVSLLVYSGTAPSQRGVDLMIEALPHLDGAHVALVVSQRTLELPSIQSVLARAGDLGMSDRVHTVPYVPYWQVSSFLSAADIGVIPIHHWLNHEIALIQKFFEYSHARLPVVVSDLRTMAETVRATGQGEVFRAGDLDDYIRAVRAVLGDPQKYRAAYDKPGLLDGWTWESQVPVLEAVYDKLAPSVASR
jgi:glycosyltransferase involved in cell wall biosynthesis